jgi:hypothetical protein
LRKMPVWPAPVPLIVTLLTDVGRSAVKLPVA